MPAIQTVLFGDVVRRFCLHQIRAAVLERLDHDPIDGEAESLGNYGVAGFVVRRPRPRGHVAAKHSAIVWPASPALTPAAPTVAVAGVDPGEELGRAYTARPGPPALTLARAAPYAGFLIRGERILEALEPHRA